MDAAMDRTYRVIRLILDRYVGNLAAIGLLFGTLFAILEIVRRYIFNVVYEWGGDFVIFVIIGSVFSYFAVTQAKRAHLCMSAFMDVLKNRGFIKIVVATRLFVSAFSLFLFAFFAYWGVPAVERSLLRGRMSESLFLPLWPFQALLLVSFGLMALVTIFHLYQDVRELMGKKVFEWAPAEIHTDI